MTSRIGRGMTATVLVALSGCIPHVTPPEDYNNMPTRSDAQSYGAQRDASAPAQRRSRSEPRTHPLSSETPDADGRIRTTDIPSSVSQPTPAWVAQKVEPDAHTIGDSTYIVKSGDTLRSIGNRTGAGSEAIARANNIGAPFGVQTGQRLKIPGGRYHLVHQGQTGVAIARAYGVSWSTIADLNDLQPPYILRNGERLLLPSAAETAQMTPEQRAKAFSLDIDDLATGSEPAIPVHEAPKQATATPRKPLHTDVAVAEPGAFTGRFQWPLTGEIIGKFGPAGDGRRNDGINIAAERGEDIHAAADGVVAYAGSAIAVYGGLILIKHGDGWITAYGHAEQLLVTRGQSVKRGDVIGKAGATGSVNRPQLHFEIRNKRTPVDPLRYLPSAQR